MLQLRQLSRNFEHVLLGGDVQKRGENVNESFADTRSKAAESARESRWQFSIRGVLLLTLMAGAVLSLIAPSIRSWDAEAALDAVLQLAIVALPTTIAMLLNFVQERTTRATAGRLIATLRWPGALDRAVLLWMATMGMVVLTLIVVFVETTHRGSTEGALCTACMLSLGALIVFPPTILYALTGIVPGEIEFCEYGMIKSGKRFLAISRITGWSIDRKILTLRLDAHDATSPDYGPWQFQAEIPPDKKDEVLSLLEHWCPQGSEMMGQDEEKSA